MLTGGGGWTGPCLGQTPISEVYLQSVTGWEVHGQESWGFLAPEKAKGLFPSCQQSSCP